MYTRHQLSVYTNRLDENYTIPPKFHKFPRHGNGIFPARKLSDRTHSGKDVLDSGYDPGFTCFRIPKSDTCGMLVCPKSGKRGSIMEVN